MSEPLTQEELSARIEALLQANDFGRAYWTTSAAAPITFTYKFETAAAADFPWTDVTGVTGWTESMKAQARVALAEYASIFNLQLVEITSAEDANISLYRASNLGNPGTAGRGRWQYAGSDWDGSVVFRSDIDLALQSNYDLLIHEAGHAFGLKHPGNYDVGGNNPPGPFLPADEDNDKLSVMSYNTNPTSGLESRHLMLYDIAALQAFWGADLTTRTGNDVYTGPDDGRIQTIWDAGGIDTFQFTGVGSAVIDLRPGTFSSMGSVDNLAIAYGTSIENAIGGALNDTIRGNDAANEIAGNLGSDTIDAGLGADIVNGGGGADFLTGGADGDTFQFALADLEAGVTDTVADYTAGSDVLRFITNTAGDAVSTSGANALVTFGNGYQVQLTGAAGSVVRLDFDNRLEYWDTGTNASWDHYTDYLDSGGNITDQEIINDNGTITQRHINQAGAAEYTDFFNASSQLTDQEVVNLDGTREQRHYDVSPGGTAQPWIQYIDYINAAGATTDQSINFDNGTFAQRHIGQAGTQEYTDYVDANGVLLDQEVINLDGTREQRHYDPFDLTSAYQSYTDFFNSSSLITAQSVVFDNLFQDQTFYAVAGDTSHGTTNHYNASGQLIGTTTF